jgi:thiamine pyrophosphokinase
VLDDYSKIFRLPNHYEKWYPAQTPISLIPVGEVTQIATEGLVYNLQKENLTLGYRTGSSNETAQDGFVKISYQTGDLLLMECLD